VFANGKIWHRGGQEKNSAAIIASAVVAYAWYATSASLLSGFVLGLAGAWIGLTLQHCGNHGAMTRWAWVNDLLGFTNDIAGGSSLCWRYHHQVSHHIHTNVHDVDQDVYSATLSGKVIHFSLLLGVPAYIHGLWAILPAYFMYPLTQGIALAATFAVSHNLDEVKQTPLSDDWAVAQVENSANWGGAIGNFFTGGLNYQIEHHLFPSIGFGYYPAIGKIVEEECGKRGIHYAKYKTLPEILAKFCDFMAKTGAAPAPTDVIKVVKA
jgi:fatty acid desaturase